MTHGTRTVGGHWSCNGNPHAQSCQFQTGSLPLGRLAPRAKHVFGTAETSDCLPCKLCMTEYSYKDKRWSNMQAVAAGPVTLTQLDKCAAHSCTYVETICQPASSLKMRHSAADCVLQSVCCSLSLIQAYSYAVFAAVCAPMSSLQLYCLCCSLSLILRLQLCSVCCSLSLSQTHGCAVAAAVGVPMSSLQLCCVSSLLLIKLAAVLWFLQFVCPC